MILATLIIASKFLEVHSNSIPTSCNQTPYPQVCNHYMNNSNNNNLLSTLDLHDQEFAFRDLALKVTMDQAIEAHRLVTSTVNLNSLGHDERAKLAWDDCSELYEDTIDKLSRSMSSKDVLDANTWLSASIANQQTCQNGFIDLNIPISHLQSSLPNFYKLSTDLSMLLSNSLAIHKAWSTSSSSSSSAMNFNKQVRGRRLLLKSDDGFPEWVSASDRKLLQSNTGPKSADIVVSQDGSGNYKSITEAVAAAKKSSGSGTKRVVIYVKAGVYKENVEIKKTMKRLMFVGDGMDATIVSGNKNAQDGSTTFRSATFGTLYFSNFKSIINLNLRCRLVDVPSRYPN